MSRQQRSGPIAPRSPVRCASRTHAGSGAPRPARARPSRRRSRTISRPPASMPAPTPRPSGPAHRTTSSASRARGRPPATTRRGRRHPLLRAAEQPPPEPARSRRRSPSVPARLAQLRRELVQPQRHVQTDPDAPPSAPAGRPSTRIPATLRRRNEHVVRPFQTSARAHHLRHRHPGGQRQQPRRIADHDRAQQRPPRRRAPRPPLTAAAGGLLAGGDERAVRRSARSRARARARWSSRSAGGGPAGAPSIAPRRHVARPTTHTRPDPQLVVHGQAEPRGRAASVDGDREAPIGVLVQEQLAGPGIGERADEARPGGTATGHRQVQHLRRPRGRTSRAHPRSTSSCTLPKPST